MAKKTTSEEGVETPATITVIVTGPLAEGGTHYNAGDTLETTPDRAAALGDLVKPAEAV